MDSEITPNKCEEEEEEEDYFTMITYDYASSVIRFAQLRSGAIAGTEASAYFSKQ